MKKEPLYIKHIDENVTQTYIFEYIDPQYFHCYISTIGKQPGSRMHLSKLLYMGFTQENYLKVLNWMNKNMAAQFNPKV
jgi:hypothetical protein